MGVFSFTILTLVVFAPSFWGLRRYWLHRREVLELFKRDAIIGFSTRIDDYLLSPDGQKRSNFTERRFRRRYFFDLLEVFEHQCANCKRAKLKLEMDHFFIPKSRGGNLMMRHKCGYWVCNGILLCRRCNANKADQRIEDFFEENILKEILKKNIQMSFLINGLDPKEYQGPHNLSSDH
jgi:5-methylcytosine-specific restriction endonuclease McrA